MQKEIWKDINGYIGLYQVSNLGNVKSLKRIVKDSRLGTKFVSERILKNRINSCGYYHVVLCKNGNQKSRTVHQLVSESFLNHKPNGHKLVVNHKDLNQLNNNVDNLELVTQRTNANQKHLKSSSQYIGVSYLKRVDKWASYISIKGKKKHIGTFNKEYDAHLAYQEKLKSI